MPKNNSGFLRSVTCGLAFLVLGVLVAGCGQKLSGTYTSSMGKLVFDGNGSCQMSMTMPAMPSVPGAPAAPAGAPPAGTALPAVALHYEVVKDTVNLTMPTPAGAPGQANAGGGITLSGTLSSDWKTINLQGMTYTKQ